MKTTQDYNPITFHLARGTRRSFRDLSRVKCWIALLGDKPYGNSASLARCCFTTPKPFLINENPRRENQSG